MFDQKVLVPEQFPVPQKTRHSTDVCCTIIGAIFALTLFILACVFWNQGNYDRLTSLRDSNGKVCEKFLHYPNIKDTSKTQCVNSCPSGYKSSSNAGGSVCLPKNASDRQKLLSDSGVSSNYDFYNYRTVILWSSLIALGVGLLWMTITHCFPRIVPILAFVFAILALIAMGVLFLILDGGFWRGAIALKIVVAVLCFVLALILLVMICMYSSEVKFQGIMLEYSVRFLNENPFTFAYIPVYLIFTAGLFALILWQQACFSSWWGEHIGFATGGVLGVLNVLEFIWEIHSISVSLGVLLTGYWTKNSSCYAPYQRLVCKHWGSVVGGSFLNAFFEIPTLLIELLVCHPQTCCAKLGTICYNSCTFCTCFFDLVRTDAYSYINLSGIPFCDSARQCKKLCDRSHHFIGTQSAMKHYRFAAHVACVTLAFIASYFVLRYRIWNFNIWHLAILVIFLYAIVTYFIGIHADSAEGLQTSFLAEHELENDYNYMNRILPSYRKELGFLDGRQKMDGNC